MWTSRHWKLLYLLALIIFIILLFREYKNPLKADLPALSAAQVMETEEAIMIEAEQYRSYYREGKLLLNIAPRKELEELPGIGPVLADRIVTYRELKGNFNTIEDLRHIKGIGAKKLESLRGKVIIE